MRLLPTSLWLLIAARIEAQAGQQSPQLPTAIRRMSPDQGEKFFHEYAAFPESDISSPAGFLADARAASAPSLAARRYALLDEADADLLAANASAELTFRPPFAPHFESDLKLDEQSRLDGGGDESKRSWRALEVFRRAASALSILQGRQWSCPGGTNSCTNIGFPNSCCATGETCVKITDTGLGNVGCCPSGSNCGGSISNCAAGNTPCASDIGGGCCIPGFVCQGVGCVLSAASVTTVTMTSTTILSSPSPSTVITTVVVTITPSVTGGATTQTTTLTATASPPPITSNTGTGIVPPVRPTSTSSSDTGSNTFCPTGFYACLASAGGGCCQTGRDCHTTSCPPISYTTIINGGGITVVVPASAVPNPSPTASCANSWYLCGNQAGAVPGCCPSGYNCGTASCFLPTAGATASVAKQLPSQAGRIAASRWDVAALLVAGVAWVLLV